MDGPWDLDWQKPSGDLDPIIRSAAEKYDIPEARLRAVISTESNFDPRAVSPAGAEGLMQLMPATAKELGVTDAFDPAQNIDGGARYLKAQYDRFGNWDQAHAAYDAGPARVARGGDLPAETRDYVQKVNARAADAPPWQMGWKGDAPPDAPPWEQSWGGKPSPDAADAVKAMQDFGVQQALDVSQAAVQPADKPQPKSTEDIIGELAAMPLAERATRIAMGLPVGAVETAVQMAAQIPQMATQAAGFVKALSEGKITRKDFEESAASVTPKWVSDLANAESLQPETYAGALMSGGMGEGFAAAGRAAAAPGAGIVATTQALANGEGIEGARQRFSDLYAKVAPITEQMLNAGLVVAGGVEGARKLAAKRAPIAQDPADTAAPVLQAKSLDEAISTADQAANGPSEAAAPAEPAVEPPPEPLPGEPKIGMPPEALLPPEGEEPVAPPAEAASPEAPAPPPEVAPAAQEAPQAPVPPEAAPAAPVPEEAPQPRSVADMTPRELEMAARLTRSDARRTELADEQARRGAQEPTEPGTDLTTMTDGELDHALRLSRGASRDAIATELLSRMPREESTPETENGRDQGNAKPGEDAAGEPAQPGAPVGDRDAGNAQPSAAGAEGSSLPADAGDHRLGAGEVVPDKDQALAQVRKAADAMRAASPDDAAGATAIVDRAGVAASKAGATQAEIIEAISGRQAPPAEAPAEPVAPARFTDYAAPKADPTRSILEGEVRTFRTEKTAAAFAKQQNIRGYSPRLSEDGGWVLSKPMGESVRRPGQASGARVNFHDELLAMVGKLGGWNREDALADGVDPADIASHRHSGAFGRPLFPAKGGLSVDGIAEALAQHGYDMHDENGLIDATKARDALHEAMMGNKVYSPEGQAYWADRGLEERSRHEASQLRPTDAQMSGYDHIPDDDQRAIDDLVDSYEDVKWSDETGAETASDAMQRAATNKDLHISADSLTDDEFGRIVNAYLEAPNEFDRRAAASAGKDQGAVASGEEGRAAAPPDQAAPNAPGRASEVAPEARAEAGVSASGMPLTVTFDGRTFPVADVAEAQRKWADFRDSSMREGGGVRDIGNGIEVRDDAGKTVARISYNGTVRTPEGREIKTASEARALTAPPALELKGETEGEIRTREAQQGKDAEAAKARANAPGSEGFTLTGSDRPADVAEAHGQKPLMRRGPEPSGMTEQDVRSALKEHVQASRVPVRVVQDVETLRKEPGLEDAPDDTKGVYHNGRIYAVADNIRDALDAERTIARHEVTHAGIDALYGDSRAREVALTRVVAANPKLRELASAWRDQYGAEFMADAKKRGMGEEAAKRELRLTAFEEALAHFAQDGNEVKGWQAFSAAIQKGLRAMGLHRLADWMEGATSAEAMAFLDQARRAAMDQTQGGGRLAPAFHRAYHGSPHDFDKFDVSKIGTGEGAQAYGHGLYFAGKREVAEHYRDTLGGGYAAHEQVVKSNERLLDALKRRLDEAPEDLRALVRKDIANSTANLEKLRAEAPPKPRLFEVELAPKEHEYLDWDKPLGEQSAEVRAKLEPLRKALKRSGDLDRYEEQKNADFNEWTGQELVKQIIPRMVNDDIIPLEHPEVQRAAERGNRAEAASAYLNSLGIPGTKYFDGSSRHPASKLEFQDRLIGDVRKFIVSSEKGIKDAGRDQELRGISERALAAQKEQLSKLLAEREEIAKEVHHNYVIFDDKHVEVKAKYARAADDLFPQRMAKAAAAIKSGMSEETRQREIFRGGFRAAMATVERFTGSVDAALKDSRALVDTLPVPERWKAMQEFQAGGVGAISDTRLRPFFSAWKANVDQRTAKMQKWGEGYLKETLPNYFSQSWKDPKSALEWYQRLMAKGPLEGRKSFLKQRTYASYQEGMSWKVFHEDGSADYFESEKEAKAAARAGDTVKPPLEPLSQNFVDIAQLSLQQMDKFIAMHEIRRWLDSRGWVKSVKQGEAMPDGYAKVDDPAFRSRATFPITDAEGKPGAASIAYDYAVPELIAKDVNNYLDPGLYRFGLWKSFRYAQNLLLSARLGLSAFHAGFTTVDTTVSHVDAGARYMLMGEFGRATGMLAKAIVSPIMSPIEGTKYLKQFYGEQAADPNTAAILHFLTQGGARGRMDPTDFNNSWVKLKRAWADGDLKGTAMEALPATIEGVMRPIMHYLVPAQKMTARVLLAKLELDRVAGALGQQRGDYAQIVNAMGEDAMRQIAYRVVQQVDDRLGQVAYANLFWNKFAKDVAQASIQSVGWNVGTVNVIFGGMKDAAKIFKPEELVAPLDKAGRVRDVTMARVTGRLSYLIALNLTVGMAGASLQYLLTGEWPEDLRSYFFPKTGRKNPDGTDERMSLPSYVKDEYAFSNHPLTTVGHKLHPAFSMVSELLHNEDFYGNEIVNPDDPWTKAAGQVAAYLGKSVLPYSIQNMQQNEKKGGSVGMALAPLVGVTPAPASVSRTPFESYVAEAYRSSYHRSLTPEEQDKAQARRDALDALRKGEEPDLTPFTAGERASIYRASRTPIQEQRYARLGLQQKLAAYVRATPEERDQFKLKPLLERDFRTHGKDLSDDDRARVQDVLSE